MDHNTKYSILYPQKDCNNRIQSSETAEIKSVADESLFSLKSSSELSKAIDAACRQALIHQGQCDDDSKKSSPEAEITFINDTNFLLTINGKDYNLSCQSDKYITADVLSFPSKSNPNAAATYVGSVASNCRFKHQFSNDAYPSSKNSITTNDKKREAISVMSNANNINQSDPASEHYDVDVESSISRKKSKKKRDFTAMINESDELAFKSSKKLSTSNNKGSSNNKHSKSCVNNWLFIKDFFIGQSAIEIILDFFNPISIKNIYICPQFLTIGNDIEPSGSIDLYIEFDTILGANAALERNGESLYKIKKSVKVSLSTEENTCLSLFPISAEESVYARGCCILCPSSKQKMKISTLLKEFDLKLNVNSSSNNSNYNNNLKSDILNILQVVHINKDALISMVKTGMIASMINSAHDGTNVGSMNSYYGDELLSVNISRDSFLSIDSRKDFYTSKISIGDHLIGSNNSKINSSSSSTSTSTSKNVFMRNLTGILQQMISSYDFSNPSSHLRNSRAGMELDLLTRLLSFCSHASLPFLAHMIINKEIV